MSKFDSSPFSEEVKVMLAGFRARVLALSKSDLSLRRDDYKEFAELCTLFLDGDENDSIVTFKRPGALHKARWMAKLLYSIKYVFLTSTSVSCQGAQLPLHSKLLR